MADIRSGLIRAHNALAALARDPQRIDLARFERSPPPPYSTGQSHNSTLSHSPSLHDDEQRHEQQRQWDIELERRKSLPYDQYDAQAREEREWLLESDSRGNSRLPIGKDITQLAHENVRKRWEEQGIWSEKWTSTASGLWKHERPLESGLQEDSRSSVIRPSLFGPSSSESIQCNLGQIMAYTPEQSLLLEKQREASRPFHQFVYQLSFYRKRMLQDELFSPPASAVRDINTAVYEKVKAIWIQRKIWDERWGIMPGMAWKHERVFLKLPEEELPEPVPQKYKPKFMRTRRHGLEGQEEDDNDDEGPIADPIGRTLHRQGGDVQRFLGSSVFGSGPSAFENGPSLSGNGPSLFGNGTSLFGTTTNGFDRLNTELSGPSDTQGASTALPDSGDQAAASLSTSAVPRPPPKRPRRQRQAANDSLAPPESGVSTAANLRRRSPRVKAKVSPSAGITEVNPTQTRQKSLKTTTRKSAAKPIGVTKAGRTKRDDSSTQPKKRGRPRRAS